MAEERNEDTKPPTPRRGARPFAGPAGASSAARPFLRPTAPSPRPGPAPFAPPSAKPRLPLGSTPAIQPPRVPPLVNPPVPAAPLAASTPVAPPEVPARAPTPVAVAPVVPVAPPALPEPDPFFPVEPAPVAEEEAPVAEEPSRPARPITSEMVALDAFDAFDTVWPSSERDETPAEQPRRTAPLDPESLGGGFDTSDAWAEEITAGNTGSSTPEAVEATVPTPSIGLPAWLADDHEPTPSNPEPTAATAPDRSTVDGDSGDAGASSDHGLAAWSPPESPEQYTIPEWAEAPAAAAPDADQVTHQESLGDALAALAEPHKAVAPEVTPATEESQRFELVDEASAEPIVVPVPVDPRMAHWLRVSATLDRLAQRVRAGEIDVSFVAPEATDAAVLASILAALLGGSSNR